MAELSQEELAKELEGVTITESEEYEPTAEELALNRKQALCLYLYFKDRIGKTVDKNGNVMRVSTKYSDALGEHAPFFKNSLEAKEDDKDKLIRFWSQMFIRHVVPLGPEDANAAGKPGSEYEKKYREHKDSFVDRFGPICLLGNTPVREDPIAPDEEFMLMEVHRWRNPDFDRCHLLMLTVMMADGQPRNMMFSRLNFWREPREEIVNHYWPIVQAMSDERCKEFAEAFEREDETFALKTPTQLKS